jgi:hypothetical protein
MILRTGTRIFVFFNNENVFMQRSWVSFLLLYGFTSFEKEKVQGTWNFWKRARWRHMINWLKRIKIITIIGPLSCTVNNKIFQLFYNGFNNIWYIYMKGRRMGLKCEFIFST